MKASAYIKKSTAMNHESSDEDSDSDSDVPVIKKPSAKAAPFKKAAKDSDSDDESSEDEVIKKA